MPFGPINEPGDALLSPPAFWMSTVTCPAGVTDRSTLPVTSLNHTTPSGRHSGPSVNSNPPATFSITASFGTSDSKAGSRRTMLPTPGAAAAGPGGEGGAVEQPVRSAAREQTA